MSASYSNSCSLSQPLHHDKVSQALMGVKGFGLTKSKDCHRHCFLLPHKLKHQQL
ncbi:hypothetical protein J6590_078481 [Homalodisca vitripennis]|nr:hypothetical protein J6590_078481 [Homalodisca vitripennis]